MGRSNIEQCHLLEEKKELEDLIEQLNNNINYHKQQQSNIILSQTKDGGNDHILGQILGEKDSYINKLEQEITDMRKEIDSDREKIMMNDIRTIGESTTRGGTQY